MITLLDCDAYNLSAETDGNTYYLHFEYKLPMFTKTIYKLLLAQWGLVLEELKSRGVKEIKSIIPKEEKKVNKFQLMFGLEGYSETSKYILYRREL